MRQIAEWLAKIGLARYTSAFIDNDIDVEVLRYLTDADLEKIGVSLGHRRKLLAAIAELGGGAATPAQPPNELKKREAAEGREPTPTIVVPPPPCASTEVAGERRYLTVMFCDLVGSTGIAAQLDAEEWRDLVGAYLDAASAAVMEMGGHVARKLGDGLMALFGYPQAQENDAERAVGAALAIQRALAEINAKNHGKGAAELLARIGIESGPVVVDETSEVFGDAPNVAARVQAAAEPGSVLVTMNVQRQVAGLFVADERGARELKGVSAPVQLFRIVRASGAGRRSGARTLTPFVGRDEELGLLARRWERARAGEGQMVLIVGEPGLGKSRLIEEFHATLVETPHTWVEWSASQLLQNTPLHPIAEWGRLRFGGADVPAQQRLGDLEGTLRLIGLDPAEHAPLLAPLVDIPLLPGGSAALAPEDMRRRQLAAIVSWAIAGARAQPVVLAFEDLQWADPTSIDVMRALAERAAQAPILILATTRPEFHPSWGMRSHHTVVSLAPLVRTQVRQMVGEIASRHALSKEVVEELSERTGGVPLFVEEVTRLLLERGEEGGAPAIPPTLQQSLAARLDRLGPAREAAQIGAVLGRDFAYALLRDVAEMDEPALRAALERLADAEILFVEGEPPFADYRFKHALIQDAAYDSLLKSRRRALHRRAAEVLRDQPESAAAEPEVIAHHLTAAGLDDLAIEWWGKAGDQALRRSAFQEAIVHLGKAIEMSDRAGGATHRIDEAVSIRRLKLQSDYGQAVMWSKGYAAEETEAAFARATKLAAQAESASERFAAYIGQLVSHVFRGEFRQAEEVGEKFVHEAEMMKRRSAAAAARNLLGLICLFQGKFSESQSNLERGMADWNAARDRAQPFRNRPDYGVFATSYLGLVAWVMGDPGRAQSLTEQAIQRAINLGHVQTTVQAYLCRTLLEIYRDDPTAALRSAELLLGMARQHEMQLYAALGEVYLTWARSQLQIPQAGVAEFRRAVADYTKMGNRAMLPNLLALLAKCEADAQNFDAAGTTIDEALFRARESGERWTDAFVHRIRGDILLKRDRANPAPAEEAFQTAIAVAKKQGARSYVLLACLSLAKLYQSTSRPTEAHAVLAPALEGIAPTQEMPEIAEAQALLERLTLAGEGVIVAKGRATER